MCMKGSFLGGFQGNIGGVLLEGWDGIGAE